MMKLNHEIVTLLLIGAVFAVSTGCSTPGSVRQLSLTTSANVAVFSEQLKNFADGHAKIAEARAQTYADEVRRVADLRAKLDNLVAVQKIAGTPNNLVLYQQILDESDRQAAVHASLYATQALTLAQVEKSLVTISAPSKQLDSLAKRFSDLAAEESPAEQATALYSFYSDVREDVNKDLNQRDAAIKSLPTGPRPQATNALQNVEATIKTLAN
jgi:hypothetical protein